MRILPAIVALGLTGVVYLYHQEQKGHPEPLSKLLSSGAEWIGSAFADDESSEDGETAAGDSTTEKKEGKTEAAADNAEPVDFSEVFRFDVTSKHVGRTWTRIKSDAANVGLKGFRVPLVTGNGESDINGTLTYFFDDKQTRRITFTGTSSDPGRLVEFLEQKHQFKRAGSRNGKVSTFSSRTGCSGLLKLTAPTQPGGRFQIDLSIAK